MECILGNDTEPQPTYEFSRLTIFVKWGPFPSQQMAVLFEPLNPERSKISKGYFLFNKALHCTNAIISPKYQNVHI